MAREAVWVKIVPRAMAEGLTGGRSGRGKKMVSKCRAEKVFTGLLERIAMWEGCRAACQALTVELQL